MAACGSEIEYVVSIVNLEFDTQHQKTAQLPAMDMSIPTYTFIRSIWSRVAFGISGPIMICSVRIFT